MLQIAQYHQPVSPTKSTSPKANNSPPSTPPVRLSRLETIGCPDCAIAVSATCTRCSGTGRVCAVCRGARYLTRMTDARRSESIPCRNGCAENYAREVARKIIPTRYPMPPSALAYGVDYKIERNAEIAPLYQAANQFMQSPRGWLTLSGDVGTGKSALAGLIANTLAARGLSVAYFTTARDLLNTIRNTFGFDEFKADELRKRGALKLDYATVVSDLSDRAELLVIEEFTSAAGTLWAVQEMFGVLERRFTNPDKLFTVFTLNSFDMVNRVYNERGAALIDRMKLFAWAEARGKSYRIVQHAKMNGARSNK